MIDRRIEGEALHAALGVVSPQHHGFAHPTGRDFTYQPSTCPGCAYSVLREMFRDRAHRGDADSQPRSVE